MPTVINGGTLPRGLDPTLGDLINLRCEQLRRNYDGPLDEIVSFLVVEPGDTDDAIVEALGFSPLFNLSDRTRFGDADYTPNWEWIERHGDWFEAAFILSDDGFGHILLVQDAETTDAELLGLCKAFVSEEV